MKTILAFDPGASSGYAVARIQGDNCEIIEYGFIDVDTSSQYIGDWCLDLKNSISELQNRVLADEIAVEDYFFGARFASGSNVNPAYRTVIHMWAREQNLHYEVLNISNWKVFAAGRSTPTKEQKKRWGATPAKKLMIVQALWERFGIRFPNHSISTTTGKPIYFRFDVVDAVAQVMYASYLRFNCRNFKCTVSIPPDVIFKKVNNKQFLYD
jgi:Holliday junction resolvasome RuvABC endonuclease subunit